MILFLTFFSICALFFQCNADCFASDKKSHHLSSIGIQEIGKLKEILDNRSNIKEIFNKINLVRPVGSENHIIVKKFIKQSLQNLNWNIDEISFTVNTVIGAMDFVNIIGTQNTTKSRRLVLACHYDSLKLDSFFGSVDSALPCAMMLSVAEILSPLLSKKHDLDISLELIFFDGEEAFVQWSASDSLYGSRHLANLWHNAKNDQQCSRLQQMDAMILLDLLGAKDPNFYVFDNGNYRLFESLARIEGTIMQQQQTFKDNGHPYFKTFTVSSRIEDDHIPFLERGVSIVHLIPIPFPPQWHKTTDNANGISWNTSKDLELILSVFIVQYFHLGSLLPNLHNNDL